MKRNFKKGFTIVELVIVIAVIAILAAVLIPTFSNIVKKARASSDQQAVRQMNTVLMTESVMAPLNIYEVFDVLAQNGLSAKNYKALSDGMSFYWDSEINRVLYVDNQTGKAVYPEEYKDRTNNGKWSSLTQQIVATKPADTAYTNGGATVSVNNGQELAYVLAEKLQKDSSVNEVTLTGNVDMMGATFNGGDVNKDLTIAGSATEPVVLKNATAVEAQKTHEKVVEGQDGFYHMGLFPTVAKGKTLTIKNLVIDNLNLKDTNASNVAFLVGHLAGTLVLENVTIRNSTVIGHHNVGALVGNLEGGKIEIKGNVKLENVKVLGVGGRIGQLVGYSSTTATATKEGDVGITMTNVTTGIFECEKNVGTYQGQALGLNGNDLWSTEVLSNGTIECKARPYYATTLIGNLPSTDTSAIYTAIKGLIKQ